MNNEEHLNLEEIGYLNLISKILEKGEVRDTRNAITKSLFGEKLEFDISNSIPFITTKKLAWKTVIKELLWFLSGSTDNKKLQEQNVKIWNGNATREYMDKIGFLNREENDLGPIYGHQWRHFNAQYKDQNTDYTNQGIDQIKQVLNLLKNDPMSRRILISAWNPSQLSEMNLPPCHMMAQFYVSADKKLSCQMYQRSADVGLGLPFNIASYAVLTYILAKLSNLTPNKLIIVIGDAHIYNNHIESLKEQIKRKPFKFPNLIINPEKKFEKVEDFNIEDFIIEEYSYYEGIVMDMIA
jgi:dihydrofolate reductase/thymidylate synthase